MKFHTLIIVFLFLLSACSVREKKVAKDVVLQEQEARLADVPIPLGAKVMETAEQDVINDGGMLMQFKTAMSHDQLKTFYIQEMERYGWEITAQAHGAESLYQCHKPTRWCTIVIRPKGRTTIVSIFVGS